ncbi:MAG: protease inhibitor I42 family protein [Chitinophagales bacterium]
MKSSYFFIGIFCLSLFSCRSAKKASEKPQIKEIITAAGMFKSIKGVKDPLSCYCFNGGYLKTKDKTIAVCFEDENLSLDCEIIEVTGFFETKNLRVEKGNPCSAGSMQLLRVSEKPICKTKSDNLKQEKSDILGKTETKKVEVGKDFEIKLKANVTTGYQWFLDEKYDKNIVSLLKQDYVADKTAQPMVGSGGTAIFSLKAKKKGTTNLKFEYKRFHEKTATETKIYNIEIE